MDFSLVVENYLQRRISNKIKWKQHFWHLCQNLFCLNTRPWTIPITRDGIFINDHWCTLTSLLQVPIPFPRTWIRPTWCQRTDHSWKRACRWEYGETRECLDLCWILQLRRNSGQCTRLENLWKEEIIKSQNFRERRISWRLRDECTVFHPGDCDQSPFACELVRFWMPLVWGTVQHNMKNILFKFDDQSNSTGCWCPEIPVRCNKRFIVQECKNLRSDV